MHDRNLTEFATSALTNKYEWDAADRLVKISRRPAGGQWNLTQFSYDGLGRRIRISETTNNSTTTKSFVWSGAKLREERSSSGGTVNRRFFQQGEQISSTEYLFTRDHLGSVREMISSGGMIQARYEYDPYGQRTKISGASESDFGYTGHYYHQKSGLHLALFRALDAQTGKWISRDPIGLLGGVNLYNYSANDPINGFDPYGLFRPGQFFKGLGAFAGGLALAIGAIAAIEAPPLAVLAALSAAVALQYGIGNMVAAFSDDDAGARQMLKCPDDLPGAATQLLFGNPDDDAGEIGSVVTKLIGTTTSIIQGDALGAVHNSLELFQHGAGEDYYLEEWPETPD